MAAAVRLQRNVRVYRQDSSSVEDLKRFIIAYEDE
jgi:hypothetical protein